MKKKGSAILIVIGAITVLMVLAYGFISSSRNKTSISKYMSDERKCETIAEATADFILTYIKKNANKHEGENVEMIMKPVYYLLRAPLKKKNTSSGSGENYILDVSDIKEILAEDCIPYKDITDSLIKEIGWEENVSVIASITLCRAEAFSPDTEGYVVPTIDCKHLPAIGKSANFLDEVNGSCSGDNLPEIDWKVQVKFPEGNPTEEEIVYDVTIKPISGIDFGEFDFASIKIKVTRSAEDSPELEIKIDLHELTDWLDSEPQHTILEVLTLGAVDDFRDYIEEKTTFKVNIQKKLDGTHFFPEIDEKTLKGLKKAYTKGDPNYNFSTYAEKINNRVSTLDNNYKDCVNNFSINSCCDFDDNSYYLEKGGVLRITTTVKFSKKKNLDSPDITKILVSEIPFKASDVQPIAPEYSFFLCNSPKVGSIDDDSVAVPHELGKGFDLNLRDSGSALYGSGDTTPPDGQFIVHNVPTKIEGTSSTAVGDKEKVDYTQLEDGTRIPGMVRINSDYSGSAEGISYVKSFFGLLAQPELTEFNKIFTPFDSITATPKNKFNTLISFCWIYKDGGNTSEKRYHDLELPVIFDDNDTYPGHPIVKEPFGEGVENIINLLKQPGFKIVSVPTLLSGICHMGYPLGVVIEGPVDNVYSRTRLYVKPHGEVSIIPPKFEERTELSYSYENVINFSASTNRDDNGYGFDGSDSRVVDSNAQRDSSRASYVGMQDFKGYNDSWNPSGDFQYSPANCYDALQYAKKATKYYDNPEDFIADLGKSESDGGLKDGDMINFKGVYYIKGGEELKLTGFKYKGNGLIVAKKANIIITGDITREDNENENYTLGIIARGNAISIKKNGDNAEVYAALFSNNAPMFTNNKVNIHGNLVCNNFSREDSGNYCNIYYDNRVCTVTPFASHRKVGKFEPKRYAVSFSDNWSKFEFEKNKD